jgi:CHAD domain-containing protein
LARAVTQLRQDPSEKRVHRFRTSLRRYEAAAGHADGNQTGKLEKQLEKLRKLAGKVRNIDVQKQALAALKVSSTMHGAKQTLLEHLADERAQRQRKLLKQLDQDKYDKLKKRLRKSAGDHRGAGNRASALVEARALLQAADANFQITSSPRLTKDNLHDLRLHCKRVRYTAELAGDGNQDAAFLVEQMQQVQDAIGEWHDWESLTAVAVKVLGKGNHVALISVLSNTANSKFRHAVRLSIETISMLVPSIKKAPQAVAVPQRKAATQA